MFLVMNYIYFKSTLRLIENAIKTKMYCPFLTEKYCSENSVQATLIRMDFCKGISELGPTSKVAFLAVRCPVQTFMWCINLQSVLDDMIMK